MSGLVERMSVEPHSRILGVPRGGSLAVGKPADITIAEIDSRNMPLIKINLFPKEKIRRLMEKKCMDKIELYHRRWGSCLSVCVERRRRITHD